MKEINPLTYLILRFIIVVIHQVKLLFFYGLCEVGEVLHALDLPPLHLLILNLDLRPNERGLVLIASVALHDFQETPAV